MKYLLVLLTSSLSTAKVTLQGRLAKRMNSVSEAAFFNSLIFFAAAMLFFPFVFYASGVTFAYAAIYAVFNVLFQTVYAGALSRGNVSVAVMFANFGMLVPTLVSYVLWGDKPSILRAAGIVLILISFLFTLKQGRECKKGYLVLVTVAMLANGCALTVQKLYATLDGAAELLSFVGASYLISAVLSFGTSVLSSLASGRRIEQRLRGRQILCCIGAGVALALFLTLNTYAGKTVDASFHYPTHSICAMLLSALSSAVIFHERMSSRQAIACAIGIIAILLMNF